MSEMIWACKNGDFIDLEDAVIHAHAPVVKYASAVFEGCRAYWNEEDQQLYTFRLTEHIDRLYDGMRILRFEPAISRADINDWALELLRRNGYKENAYFRILAYIDGRGDQGSRGPVSFILSSFPLDRGAEFERGFRLGVSSWIRVADRAMPPRVKCIANYHNGRLGILDAQEAGYDYPLFLTENGKVAETAGSCIFLVKNGKVITPSGTSDILESITRDTAIEMLRARNVEVAERSVDRTELYLADEIFITGTHQEICPVVSIDNLEVGNGTPGNFVRELQQEYLALVTGRAGRPEWRVRIWVDQ